MYNRRADLAIVYAAEIDQKTDMQLSEIAYERAEAQQIKVERQNAIAKATLLRSSWSSSLDLISMDVAPSILKLVAQCESGNNPKATNDTSSAKGLLQILDGTWQSFNCTGNVFDPEDNMQCGLRIATISGLHHWDPSRACWSKLLKNQQQLSKR